MPERSTHALFKPVPTSKWANGACIVGKGIVQKHDRPASVNIRPKERHHAMVGLQAIDLQTPDSPDSQLSQVP